jgi:hypothetical protein
MKQIWPNYSYSPATNVLTLTGLNIDRDQLLLVTAADRGRIMYNFADSSVTASAFTSGTNTELTLVATTAGLTTTAALVIYYDDQVASNSVTVSSLPAISGTVTANVLAGQYTTITSSSVAIGSNSGLIDISNFPNGAILSVEAQPTGGGNGVYKIQHIDGSGFGATDISVTNIFTGASAVNISASSTYSFRKNQFQTHLRFTYVSGTGANALYKILAFSESYWNQTIPISISSVTVGNSVTIGSLPAISGTVTIGAGTAQIGSVTASISGTVPISISSVTVGNSLTISSLPALVAGTAQIGSVTASINGTVPISISSVTVGNSVTIGSLPAISGTVTANTFAIQGTAVTTSNFTSTTASTVLANFNATREVLTIFNEGAGNLHICAGATCTTIAYQVRLSSGDYYEVPNHQTTITHSAVFATAGTARVTQVS